jgi:hypothetical protein
MGQNNFRLRKISWNNKEILFSSISKEKIKFKKWRNSMAQATANIIE